MLFIFSTPVLIRHQWQLKAAVFLHRYLICYVLFDRIFCSITAMKSFIVKAPGLYHKTYYGRKLRISVVSWSVCPYPRVDLSGAPLSSMLLALPANDRLGWKGLPGTYILAFYGNP